MMFFSQIPGDSKGYEILKAPFHSVSVIIVSNILQP